MFGVATQIVIAQYVTFWDEKVTPTLSHYGHHRVAIAFSSGLYYVLWEALGGHLGLYPWSQQGPCHDRIMTGETSQQHPLRRAKETGP
ncbi:hypothetical protein Taro_011235 [Colocasia esculenta]|uniref:Uncharacterized protein n=1 Tax=Colocasia esculenta TaxID=4460 RepID=A0A843U9B8_COLES|nr:hypothetical protein [Colocasia esculenta]